MVWEPNGTLLVLRMRDFLCCFRSADGVVLVLWGDAYYTTILPSPCVLKLHGNLCMTSMALLHCNRMYILHAHAMFSSLIFSFSV